MRTQIKSEEDLLQFLFDCKAQGTIINYNIRTEVYARYNRVYVKSELTVFLGNNKPVVSTGVAQEDADTAEVESLQQISLIRAYQKNPITELEN